MMRRYPREIAKASADGGVRDRRAGCCATRRGAGSSPRRRLRHGDDANHVVRHVRPQRSTLIIAVDVPETGGRTGSSSTMMNPPWTAREPVPSAHPPPPPLVVTSFRRRRSRIRARCSPRLAGPRASRRCPPGAPARHQPPAGPHPGSSAVASRARQRRTPACRSIATPCGARPSGRSTRRRTAAEATLPDRRGGRRRPPSSGTIRIPHRLARSASISHQLGCLDTSSRRAAVPPEPCGAQLIAVGKVVPGDQSKSDHGVRCGAI